MSFTGTKSALASFASRLERDCGRSLIETVTVQEPSGEMAELYFMKLVNWSYVVTNEAAQTPLKHIGKLMSVSQKELHAEVAGVQQSVLNLRTAQVHNLPESSSSNQHKVRQANIWLDQAGGAHRDWSLRCTTLIERMTFLIQSYEHTWDDATANEDDKRLNIDRLLKAVDGTWAPHVFDDMVRTAASQLGIDELDVVSYRNMKIENWRGLASCFNDRKSAERWLSEAICNELASTFIR